MRIAFITIFAALSAVACSGSSTLDNGPGGDVPVSFDGIAPPDYGTADGQDASAPTDTLDVNQTDVVADTAGTDNTGSDTSGTDTQTDKGDVGPVGGCEGCSTGTLTGLTCAPDGQTAIPDVKVWVETLDCDGKTVVLEATSDATGTYTIENVPCGLQTVNMEKGSFTGQFAVFVEQNTTTLASSNDRCFAANAAKIAVVSGDWDSIEWMLDKLKLDYDWYDGNGDDGWGGGGDADQFLHDGNKLNKYDVVFINCSPTNEEIMDSYVASNLQAYVKKGGSLYLSDYAFVYFEQTWPQFVDFPGNPYVVNGWQTANGTIVDPMLLAYLGGLGNELIDLKYDLGPLVKAEAVAPETMLHVEAYFSKQFKETLPVMMSFKPEGEDGGRVVYTTFHNSEQANQMNKLAKIINYLVFLL